MVNLRLGRKEAWRPTDSTFHNIRFFFIFQTNFAMVTLGLKEMGKFLWEGKEKKSTQLAVSV